jgi:hypothetical protein
MTVTLNYDAVLSTVRVSATGLAAADVALVERSTDQIRWTTVRGGNGVSVVGGALQLALADSEFDAGVVNYYRVTGIETGAITYVAAGAAATGNNTSITPAFPAGLVAGDLLVTLASIRNSGTGTVNTPTGWTVLATSGNVALLGRRYVAGDVAQLITFTGGAANADTLAQTIALRRAALPPVTVAAVLNGSGQNIAYPAAAVTVDGAVILRAGWKQDDWTSVATLAGATEIGEPISTAGSDAGQVWDYLIQTVRSDIGAGSFTVTGGAGAISRGLTVVLQHAAYLQQQTANITPTLSAVWLKSVARPFLNRTIEVILPTQISVTRPARAGLFEIKGRTFPVAITSVRGSPRWTMFVRTYSSDDASNTRLLLASGDVLLIQTPPQCSSPSTGYVLAGDVVEDSHPLRPAETTFTVPVTEVAAPGADVVGALSTWQTVIDTYATWADVIAANATWAALLTLVGDPSEVIVP